jgi:hypothetical protein
VAEEATEATNHPIIRNPNLLYSLKISPSSGDNTRCSSRKETLLIFRMDLLNTHDTCDEAPHRKEGVHFSHALKLYIISIYIYTYLLN